MMNICNMKETKREGGKEGREKKMGGGKKEKKKESSAYVIHFKLDFPNSRITQHMVCQASFTLHAVEELDPCYCVY